MNSITYPDFTTKFRTTSVIKRANEANKIEVKYLGSRVPIILDTFDSSIELKTHKYIVPKHYKMSEFLCVIRNKLKIDEKKAIFILCNNKLVNMISNVYDVYLKEKYSDNFLYLLITAENTFG